MNIQIRFAGDKAMIRCTGALGFASHRQFRSIRDQAMAAPATVDILLDVRDLDTIDSTAIGMILFMRDRCRERGRSLRIAARAGSVYAALEAAGLVNGAAAT